MDSIDSKILLLSRDKRKIRTMWKILAEKDNFGFDSDEDCWKIHSTSSDKVYSVTSLNGKEEFMGLPIWT